MWFQTLLLFGALFSLSLGQADDFDPQYSIENSYLVHFDTSLKNLTCSTRAVYPLSEPFGFYNFTTSFWMRPTRLIVTIFSFSTPDKENYLSLKLNLPSKFAELRYGSRMITIDLLPLIPLNVWSHIMIGTHRIGNDMMFAARLNNSMYNIKHFDNIDENKEVQGSFILGQSDHTYYNRTRCSLGTTMTGDIFNFQVWNKSIDDLIFNYDNRIKNAPPSCIQDPGNVVDWHSDRWIYSGGTSRQNIASFKCAPIVETD